MSELPCEDRGLARRVVQDGSETPLPRVGGNGLPKMWSARGISKRTDRAGADRGPAGEAPHGQGGRVGCFSGRGRGRNSPGLHVHTGAGAQYANYWTVQEIQQADADEQAKNQGP